MNTKKIQDLKLFLLFLGRKALFWGCVSFVSSLILAVCELLLALFLQMFLVSLHLIEIKQPLSFFSFKFPETDLNISLFVLVLIALIRASCQFLSTQCAVFSQESVACRLKTLSAFDMIYRKSTSAFSTSEINFRFSEIIPKTNSAMFYFFFSFSTLVQSITLYIIMLCVAYKESLTGFIGLILIAFVVQRINKSITNVSSKIPKEQLKINAIVEKMSRNYLFMKIMKKEKDEAIATYTHIINYSQHALRSNTLSFLNLALTPFLGVIFLICIIFVSQNFFHTNSLVLISFIYLLVRFVQSASNLSNYYSLFNSFIPHLKNAITYFFSFNTSERKNTLAIPSQLKLFGSSKNISVKSDKYHEEFQIERSAGGDVYITPPSGTQATSNKSQSEISSGMTQENPPEIILDSISFKYTLQEKNIISNFSLTIEPGEHIGVIGASGSGKSTLLMLLIGILEPLQGKIFYDGKSLENYSATNNFRIGYVGAEPFLMEGSIQENLLYGIKHSVTSQDMAEALKFAQIDSLIAEVGLSYKIKEDMSGLSAGQKQRICIARAFLNKPHLLILDEASANLDEQTELEIANAIHQLQNCSVIMISHRAGFLNNIKKIIKL